MAQNEGIADSYAAPSSEISAPAAGEKALVAPAIPLNISWIAVVAVVALLAIINWKRIEKDKEEYIHLKIKRRKRHKK